MGLIYAITSAVLIWIVLWALSFKSFDALLIAAAVIVVATMIWRVLSYLPSRSGSTTGSDTQN